MFNCLNMQIENQSIEKQKLIAFKPVAKPKAAC